MTDDVNGLVIQGPDGSIYAIPEHVLTNFKVEGDDAGSAPQAFESDEVSGFDFGSTLTVQSATFQPIRAFSGPLNSWGLRANLGEEPTEPDEMTRESFRR